MTKLRTKIARIEARNPRNRGLVGLRAKLRRLEEELFGDTSPAMNVSARLGKSIDDPVRLPLGRRLLSALVSKPINLTRTDDDFYIAIIACRKNLTTCELEYGPMSEWDVSRVTDMSYAFCTGNKFGSYGYGTYLPDRGLRYQTYGYYEYVRRIGYVVKRKKRALMYSGRSRSRQGQLYLYDFNGFAPRFFQRTPGRYGQYGYPGEFGAAYKDAPNFSRDLSRWDVSSVTDMGAMFEDFEGDVGDLSQWNTSSVLNMDAMFMQRYNGRYGKRYFNDTGEWKDFHRLRLRTHRSIDGNIDVPRTTMILPGATFGNLSGWNVSSVRSMRFTFSGLGRNWHNMFKHWDVSSVTNMDGIFFKMTNQGRIGDIGSWDVKNVKSMELAFAQIGHDAIDGLGKWDPKRVQKMQYAFAFSGPPILRQASAWKLDSANDIKAMMKGSECTDVNISWSFGSNVDADSMFVDLNSNALVSTTCDVSNMRTTGITNFRSMFSSRSSYYSRSTRLPSGFASWDTSSATSMEMMFKGLRFGKIPSEISHWNVRKVKNMREMFSRVVVPDFPDVTSWSTASLEVSTKMFDGVTEFQMEFYRDPLAVGGKSDGPPIVWKRKHVNIENAVFYDAIEECLSEDPKYGDCSGFKHGCMSGWDVSRVTDMREAFKGRDQFDGDISAWDVSSVTFMLRMFQGASSFNQDIGNWDVRNVYNMEGMFYGASKFAQDISKWDSASLDRLGSANMFGLATSWLEACTREGHERRRTWSLSGPVSKWTCKPRTCRAYNTKIGYKWGRKDGKYGRHAIYGDVDCVGLAKKPNRASPATCTMPTTSENSTNSSTFAEVHQGNFLYAVGKCLATHPTDGACVDSKYGAMSTWDTSGVFDMSEAFSGARDFNGNIENWNVASVTSMFRMFYGARRFRGSLKLWNVAQVEDMNQMFSNAYKFNGDLGDWNVRSVTDFYKMFDDAWMFDADITNWGRGDAAARGEYVCLAQHATSQSTALQPIVGDMFLNAAAWKVKYALKDEVRVTKWFSHYASGRRSSRDFKLVSISKSNMRHGPPCNWKPKIAETKVMEHIDNDNIDDIIDKCLEVDPVGGMCRDLQFGTMETWDVSRVTNMNGLFQNRRDFNASIGSWNVAQVGTMVKMFQYATSFDQDLSSWNVKKVQNMLYMFNHARAFSRDLRKWTWDVSSVTTAYGMFHSTYFLNPSYRSPSFAENIKEKQYNTHRSDHQQFIDLFAYSGTARGFSPLRDDRWSLLQLISSCRSQESARSNCMGSNFSNYSPCCRFGPLNMVDTSEVRNFRGLFRHAGAFGSTAATIISAWNTASATDMSEMFAYNRNFNQNLSAWNVSNVKSFHRMFAFAKSFNQDLNSWVLSADANVDQMFRGVANFNVSFTRNWKNAEQRSKALELCECNAVQQSRARLGAPRRFASPLYLAMFTLVAFVAFAAVVRRKSRRASVRECDAVLVSSRAYDYGSTLESSRDVEASRR